MKPTDCNDGNLAEAVFEFARETHELHLELKRSNDNKAVLNRIAEMENRIMSVLSDFAARVDAKFTTIGESVDSIVASQTGITGDIAGLKELIKQLQNSPGGITPEDQALLDALEAKVNTTSDRATGVATALAALDAETENPPTPTPS